MRNIIFCSLLSSLLFSACVNEDTKPFILDTSDLNTPDQGNIFDPNNNGTHVGVCGDGVLDSGEICDGDLYNTQTNCDFFGYDTGVVRCTPDCNLDLSGCVKNKPSDNNPNPDDPIGDNNQFTSVCGNGIKEKGEDCDTPYSVGLCSQYGDFNKGEVFCTSSCTLNLSNCVKEVEPDAVCGNGVKEVGEECDDGNMDNTDMCTNNCTVRRCGDGFLAQDEECDGNLFSASSCSAFNPNYDSGSLRCTSSCKIDTSYCTVSPKCGDGVINSSSEECDGSVGSHTCLDIYEQATGSVSCVACKLNYNECTEICPTWRAFIEGQYSNGSTTFHFLADQGKRYIIMDNKVGKIVDSTTLQWVYSSVGDEGYYSYFKVGDCDCNSCNISFNNTSYLHKSDVTPVANKVMTYSTKTVYSVPEYTIPSIVVPESLRTNKVYYSCNHTKCEDKNSYLLEINDSTLRVFVGTSQNYNFSLIKSLGNGVYLTRFESGHSLPEEVRSVPHPYAVIRIEEGQKYRVCDNFNVKDLEVTILSWSQYRDSAIGLADFTLPANLYKYTSKYSADSCDDKDLTEKLAKIYLTDKDNIGMNLYEFSPRGDTKFFYKYCRYRTSYVATYERDSLITNREEDNYLGYISTYRDNVIVFDGYYSKDYVDLGPYAEYYDTATFSESSYGTSEGEPYGSYGALFYYKWYGRYHFEVIFPNKSFMDAYLAVNGWESDIALVPTWSQNSNTSYNRNKENKTLGLDNEIITVCKVNLDDESRECKETRLTISKRALLHSNFLDDRYALDTEHPGRSCSRWW